MVETRGFENATASGKKTATTNDQGIATINPLRPGNVNHTIQVTYPTGEKVEKTQYIKAWSTVKLALALKLESMVSWNESYKLAWVDFKGTPDPLSDIDAGTTVRLYYKYKCDTARNFTFEAKAVFLRDKSYVNRGTETDELLKHEQGHFDIAEIYTNSRLKCPDVPVNIDQGQRTFQEHQDIRRTNYTVSRTPCRRGTACRAPTDHGFQMDIATSREQISIMPENCVRS